mgnify:FL=1
MSTPVRSVADTATVCTALVLTNGWLQVLVALATLIWIGLRVFESPTVRGAIIRRRCKAATKHCPQICSPDYGCEHYPVKRK